MDNIGRYSPDAVDIRDGECRFRNRKQALSLDVGKICGDKTAK